ncbi:hypothetical protein [Hymenobacter lucidus]|uniref:Ig-like domain-containing protein n=1 Tax=Hymenobacter lucidus TaxID=2880930 RepID=A0ABS8AM91_9BACT|nr:hypothetical protein [Hymenobacter lucidus]MCB2407335.1 hypothetical protein [Hymenobacter lucidus]
MKTFIQSIVVAVLVSGTLLSCSKQELDELHTTTTGQDASKKTDLNTLTLAPASATQTSINLRVTADATTGAPAGFTLQWMSAAAYAANGNRWASDQQLCKASFSGNANRSRYQLAPGQSVVVNVGELLFDNGASTNCGTALSCTVQDYVFRAFAHATNTQQRSEFTAATPASTLPCHAGATCTYTASYWSTHGPIPVGNNQNEWRLTSLQLGSVVYTDLQALAILLTPADGNELIMLAHQLITAKLNLAKGAEETGIADYIAQADAQIGSQNILNTSASTPISGANSGYITTATTPLINYNEGASGPGHCAEAED